MSETTWTDIQFKRLKELNADPEAMDATFDASKSRNQFYQTLIYILRSWIKNHARFF